MVCSISEQNILAPESEDISGENSSYERQGDSEPSMRG